MARACPDLRLRLDWLLLADDWELDELGDVDLCLRPFFLRLSFSLSESWRANRAWMGSAPPFIPAINCTRSESEPSPLFSFERSLSSKTNFPFLSLLECPLPLTRPPEIPSPSQFFLSFSSTSSCEELELLSLWSPSAALCPRRWGVFVAGGSGSEAVAKTICSGSEVSKALAPFTTSGPDAPSFKHSPWGKARSWWHWSSDKKKVLPPTSKELNLPFASSPRLACTAMVTQLSPDVPTTTASRQRGSSKPLDKHTKAFEPIVTAIWSIAEVDDLVRTCPLPSSILPLLVLVIGTFASECLQRRLGSTQGYQRRPKDLDQNECQQKA